MLHSTIKDTRSGVHASNLQEVLDAATSGKHALQGGQQQYQTPEWLARACSAMFPFGSATAVLDPQCAGGNLLRAVESYHRYGSDIDNRFLGRADDDKAECISRITASCVHVFDLLDQVDEGRHVQFDCIVSNPPFAIRWKQPGDAGDTIDSTEWTWKHVIKTRLADLGYGYIISNANTLERLGIATDPWCYLYQRFPAGGIWKDCNVELGIVHFRRHDNRPKDKPATPTVKHWSHVPSERELAEFARTIRFEYVYRPYTSHYKIDEVWEKVAEIVREERLDRPKFNIYLGKDGVLRTYLSTLAQIKIVPEEIERLASINNCHPLTLTTERETRKLLHHYLTSGIYTIQPEAKKAIADALAEVNSLACPIRPVTDFESVAYAEEEDTLKCRAITRDPGFSLTPGNRYEVRTGTYSFTEKFSRKKIHYNEEEEKTEIEDHDCQLSGEDRYIEITDDKGRIHRFMDRPSSGLAWHHPETMLWELFERPVVPTVAETCADAYNRNLATMRFNEMIAGFQYFPGQLDYYARMGCKDHGIIGADVGTGKSLGALTMIALKGPRRTLLIAPQGTMRSSGEDEDDVDYQASQWVTEIRRFAPGEPVFQLFSESDLRNILHANAGELPPGIYITYPQAYFSNGGFEHIPDSWENKEEERFCQRFGFEFTKDRPNDDYLSRSVGCHNKAGIRCIATPSLATIVEARFGDAWEMVIIDEAHLCCNIEAQITKNLIRLQPKYRFAMTATPIPNILSNIFSLMGWVCVPEWHKGGKRNAAWPYAVDEIGRFNSTFLSTEVDLTAQQKAKAAGKKSWRQSGTKFSPVISSPARLLKLLKPNMAYISKEDCNPRLNPCQIIDVRVAMGKEQSALYAYWLDQGNYFPEFKSRLTIAQVQQSRLRGICASPSGLDYSRGMCRSNFNPKTVTILQLIVECLRRGEQVVVVAARKGQSSALATRLNDAGIPVARIDSTVAPELHAAEAARFKKGTARVMLMGIKCAQGHSFDQCPNLIIGSLEWSYGTLHQAKGRVWRLTSPKPVKIWCVLHQNTIEELLFDRVATKQDAATLCLQGRRVPRDFQRLDANEIIAEHIVNFDAGDGEILSESECESQWPELRKKLVHALRIGAAGVAIAA